MNTIPQLEELSISPAPWRAEHNCALAVDCVIDADNKLICGVAGTPNVRLFAAAPELYTALAWLVELVEDGGCDSDYYVGLAKAALAKAAGGAE